MSQRHIEYATKPMANSKPTANSVRSNNFQTTLTQYSYEEMWLLAK